MDKTQKALIGHITDSGLFRTVKPYQGELKEAGKLPAILPAALPVFITGSYKEKEKRMQFDVLVVTETRTFDKGQNTESNLKIASDLMEYCNENLVFSGSDGTNYCFNRDIYNSNEREHPFTCDLIVQDSRFTVIAVHLSILS